MPMGKKYDSYNKEEYNRYVAMNKSDYGKGHAGKSMKTMKSKKTKSTKKMTY